jgi:membrane protein implicated in regulation of membrane protease activity
VSGFLSGLSDGVLAGQLPGGLAPLWLWAGLGLVLAVAELLLPGYFLIWLAGAALLTALLAGLTGAGVAFQVVVFAVLALALVLAARRWIARERAAPRTTINDRAAQVIGAVVVVTQALEGGEGRVALGDGEWLARGEDAPVGARRKVVGVEGTRLVVGDLS